MLYLITASLLVLQTAPAQVAGAAPVELNLEQKTALRCSVAIAVAADQQRAGTVVDPGWPDLNERGREFFVRSLARLMDETGLDRNGIARFVEPEVEALKQPDVLQEVMPACLLMLETSGL